MTVFGLSSLLNFIASHSIVSCVMIWFNLSKYCCIYTYQVDVAACPVHAKFRIRSLSSMFKMWSACRRCAYNLYGRCQKVIHVSYLNNTIYVRHPFWVLLESGVTIFGWDALMNEKATVILGNAEVSFVVLSTQMTFVLDCLEPISSGRFIDNRTMSMWKSNRVLCPSTHTQRKWKADGLRAFIKCCQ